MKFLIFSLLLISGIAFADYEYYDPPVVTTIIQTTDQTGVASAIAAGQCQFDWTHSWQGCAALGMFDGNSAAAFGLGKRYDEFLFNGTVSIEEGEIGVGASINWKF